MPSHYQTKVLRMKQLFSWSSESGIISVTFTVACDHSFLFQRNVNHSNSPALLYPCKSQDGTCIIYRALMYTTHCYAEDCLNVHPCFKSFYGVLQGCRIISIQVPLWPLLLPPWNAPGTCRCGTAQAMLDLQQLQRHSCIRGNPMKRKGLLLPHSHFVLAATKDPWDNADSVTRDTEPV